MGDGFPTFSGWIPYFFKMESMEWEYFFISSDLNSYGMRSLKLVVKLSIYNVLNRDYIGKFTLI